MGTLKRVLFALGLLLCIYPIVGQHINKVQQESIDSEGVIGLIRIPKVDVLLPIYEGTSEAVLQKGIGHLEESSAPSGGIGTHCLLAGHRGLPNAELFRRLGELKKGDLFSIEDKSNTYTYQVCNIRVVRPEETEGLGICKDRDLVSLITCTPYGINTHRLIVTGERMEARR